jgi:hypothetical protein
MNETPARDRSNVRVSSLETFPDLDTRIETGSSIVSRSDWRRDTAAPAVSALFCFFTISLPHEELRRRFQIGLGEEILHRNSLSPFPGLSDENTALYLASQILAKQSFPESSETAATAGKQPETVRRAVPGVNDVLLPGKVWLCLVLV